MRKGNGRAGVRSKVSRCEDDTCRLSCRRVRVGGEIGAPCVSAMAVLLRHAIVGTLGRPSVAVACRISCSWSRRTLHAFLVVVNSGKVLSLLRCTAWAGSLSPWERAMVMMDMRVWFPRPPLTFLAQLTTTRVERVLR